MSSERIPYIQGRHYSPRWSHEDPNHSPRSSFKRITVLILMIALGLAMFSVGVVLSVQEFRLPYLPDFSLTSVSTTVSNNVIADNHITADLDVSFLVQNEAEKGMIFDHLIASANQRYKLDYYHAKAGTPLDPFELGGRRDAFKENVRFRLKNMTLGFPSWDVKNSSEFSFVNFGLTSNVTYRGKIWPKQRIPIHVRCHPVRIPFSLNATETKTVHLGVNCGVAGCGKTLIRCS